MLYKIFFYIINYFIHTISTELQIRLYTNSFYLKSDLYMVIDVDFKNFLDHSFLMIFIYEVKSIYKIFSCFVWIQNILNNC